MITVGSANQISSPVAPVTLCKVIGVGGGGLAFLEQLHRDSAGSLDLLGVHTEARALMESSAQRKLQIGREAVRGLGSGGEPSLGQAAAQESAGAICEACGGAELVLVCAGLGGGTGSGAAPVVAREARRAGALVVGVVTMPFAGEGGKRRQQAEQALARLGRHCVAVLCFENDRMGEVAPADASVSEAFGAASATISLAARAVIQMLGLPAVLHVGPDELTQVFRGADARCHFGHGSASGSDRAREAVESAMQSVLLDSGRILSEPGDVLVYVTAGPVLRLAEVQTVLGEVSRHLSPSSQVLLGAAESPDALDGLSVVIMAATRSGIPVGEAAGAISDPLAGELEAEDAPEVELEPVAEAAPAKPGGKRGGKSSARREGPGETQPELPLDQALRGRFKDLDPTMVEGQDLDIPTYIRLRLRLK